MPFSHWEEQGNSSQPEINQNDYSGGIPIPLDFKRSFQVQVEIKHVTFKVQDMNLPLKVNTIKVFIQGAVYCKIPAGKMAIRESGIAFISAGGNDGDHKLLAQLQRMILTETLWVSLAVSYLTKCDQRVLGTHAVLDQGAGLGQAVCVSHLLRVSPGDVSGKTWNFS